MPINQLVNFCHASINKNGKCAQCIHECQNRCNLCLQDSHFDNAREYDCQNMIFCYTCSYIYKYASEIGHLFNLLNYNSFTEFNILNLGCGSCADLFGINSFLTQRNRQIPVSYTGIDMNVRWGTTQNQIIQIFPYYNIRFILSDVFDYLNGINDDDEITFNILTLQYIINELNKHCHDRIDEFVTLLVSKLIDKMPGHSTIIINDINIDYVRNISAKIFAEALKNNIVSNIGYRFRNPTTHTYGGYMHQFDNILYAVPQYIVDSYDVKHPCSSAQLVIFKTQNK